MKRDLVVRSINDLMELYDAAFVEAAYHAMLRRGADPSGKEYYLRRLRAGYGRIAVLDQMSKGDEANPRWEEVSGLRRVLHRYRAARRSLGGWWWLLTDAEVGRSRRFRRVRTLNNAVGRLRQETVQALASMQRDQEVLRDLMLTLLQSGSGQGGASGPRHGSNIVEEPRNRTAYDVRELDLSRSGRAVLRSLRP